MRLGAPGARGRGGRGHGRRAHVPGALGRHAPAPAVGRACSRWRWVSCSSSPARVASRSGRGGRWVRSSWSWVASGVLVHVIENYDAGVLDYRLHGHLADHGRARAMVARRHRRGGPDAAAGPGIAVVRGAAPAARERGCQPACPCRAGRACWRGVVKRRRGLVQLAWLSAIRWWSAATGRSAATWYAPRGSACRRVSVGCAPGEHPARSVPSWRRHPCSEAVSPTASGQGSAGGRSPRERSSGYGRRGLRGGLHPSLRRARVR